MYHAVQLLYDKVPMYVYEFRDGTAPFYFPEMPGFVAGAYHTGDSQYIFPLYHGGPMGITHPLNAAQEELSDHVVAIWTNFAKTGNPNGLGNSPWPRYTGPNGGLWFIQDIRPAGLSTVTDAQFVAEHSVNFGRLYLSSPDMRRRKSRLAQVTTSKSRSWRNGSSSASKFKNNLQVADSICLTADDPGCT
jgi:hypothetical protein